MKLIACFLQEPQKVTLITQHRSSDEKLIESQNLLPGSFCIVYTVMDLCTWIVVFQYYSIIKQMSKLREEAIIQCPAPIATPYPYVRENIYESQNGLRHQVCDNDQYSCVA